MPKNTGVGSLFLYVRIYAFIAALILFVFDLDDFEIFFFLMICTFSALKVFFLHDSLMCFYWCHAKLSRLFI